MEVTPEMYAWLSSQKVIDPFESFKTDIENLNNFKINQRTIDLLIGGKYMDNILKSLQDAYNKFYNLFHTQLPHLISLLLKLNLN